MIEARMFADSIPDLPIVIAVFSYRYDAHLVPDFIANIRPFVHGYVAWDDRAAATELTSEPERRNRLLAEARKLGARWILAADPDERIEDGFAKRLPQLLAQGETNLWVFSTREMFTSDSYRVDGLWQEKRRLTLFPIAAAGKELNKSLHGEWVAARSGFQLRDADVNFYHFRMATPARRKLRRELYATVDPTRKFQAIGYDYLDDERGMVLEQIPKGREFSPPFQEDHGLWSPDPERLGSVLPDPFEVRLNYVTRSLRFRGHGQASHVMQDLAAMQPEDPDLLPIAALLAMTVGDMVRTWSLASAILGQSSGSVLALYLRGKASACVGGHDSAQADLTRLEELAPKSLFARDLRCDADRPDADFTRPDANWRRWVREDAICKEGSKIAASSLAVVVIGYQAQQQLAAAVGSLCAQDPPCEIVVVNSGGGDVEAVLAGYLDRIRLITTDQHLYVGAARNIGIDASRANIIGFLAGDCQALPGWVSGRLREHRLGARTVSNPIVPESGANLLGIAAVSFRYAYRSQNTLSVNRLHYGRSYTREILSLAGYFPTCLKVSEDTALNSRIDPLSHCVWAQDVLTANKDPRTVWGLLKENYARGKRMAETPPYRDKAGRARPTRDFWRMLFKRLFNAHQLLSADRSLRQGVKLRLFLAQVLITLALGAGVARTVTLRARADRAEQRARAALLDNSTDGEIKVALRHARKAFALDPQDLGKAMLLGDALVRQGQDGTDAYRSALALDPTQDEPLAKLVAAAAVRKDRLQAVEIAETAAQNASQTRAHWQMAADMAANAGLKELATAYAQRALSLAPGVPEAHLKAESLYLKVGNLVAAKHRRATAMRLQADHDRRKADRVT